MKRRRRRLYQSKYPWLVIVIICALAGFGVGGALQPVIVDVGLTDGVSTEILSGNLKPGDKIVILLRSDYSRASSTQTKTRIPGFGGPGIGGGPPPPP